MIIKCHLLSATETTLLNFDSKDNSIPNILISQVPLERSSFLLPPNLAASVLPEEHGVIWWLPSVPSNLGTIGSVLSLIYSPASCVFLKAAVPFIIACVGFLLPHSFVACLSAVAVTQAWSWILVLLKNYFFSNTWVFSLKRSSGCKVESKMGDALLFNS